jgi:hypothetical protein
MINAAASLLGAEVVARETVAAAAKANADPHHALTPLRHSDTPSDEQESAHDRVRCLVGEVGVVALELPVSVV